MNLSRAEACANRLVEWLSPICERVAVAGSIRRRRPECGDVDLVVIPTVLESKNLWAEVTGRSNQTWKEIDQRVTRDKWRLVRAGSEIVSWVAKDVQVDLFWATESTWGTVLMQRTGSKEHNIWLATRAIAAGGKWHPHSGLHIRHQIHAGTEEQIYAALGLSFIAPEQREAHLLPHANLCRPGMAAALTR